MGMVYKKSYTRPVPPGAEIIECDGRRIARWHLKNGHLRSADVIDGRDGLLRARGRSPFYVARYVDGSGQVVEVATRCKDRTAAQAVLTKLEREAEMIRSGLLKADEVEAAVHACQPLATHLDAYETYLRLKSGNPRRIRMVRRRLERLARECRFSALNSMSASAVERWFVDQADNGMAAATRNCYRESLVAFGRWCRRSHRLTVNPFEDLPRADQHADRKHQRRALSEPELVRLLKAARLRPLAEHGRAIVRKPPKPARSRRSRATWKREPLTYDELEPAVERARDALEGNPDLIAELEHTGRERELIYKTLVMTGLRKGELASLTVGQLELDGPVAYAVLHAADEKNRKGSNIPLRADLAAELSDWLDDRLIALQTQARRQRDPIPARLPHHSPLFNVPSGLTRIFDRDLATAGIPKRDERDRVVDIHALRVTFGTHLCAAGVPLRTAQAAMRHSKPELTANVYTDPKLLDVVGAINALPSLAVTHESTSTAAQV